MIRYYASFILLLVTVSIVFYIENNAIYGNYEITEKPVSKHCLIPDVVLPRKPEGRRITLVLHASADRIDSSTKWNLAKNRVETDFMVVADLDHMFSTNFEEKMKNFVADYLVKNPKTLLVYRIFEIHKDSEDPKTKAELRTLLSTGKAREFHVENKTKSVIERLDEWLQYPESPITVQFIKQYSDPSWEPQFVSRKHIPDFDERFRYPMRDNTVLRWHLCRANYTFAVVNTVFMYHRGFKSFSQQDELNLARKSILESTVSSISKFSKEMDVQYPNTKKQCPLLNYKKL